MIAKIEKKEIGCIARFERHLEHSVEEVWSWLTENEKLAQWFNELQVGELREGGFMRFDMPDGTVEELEITELKKHAVFEFSWWVDSVRFELAIESNGCKLVLIERIEKITDHTPKDLAGWHVCLDVIVALMDGRTIARMEEWKKWFEEYKQVIGEVTQS
ncbi:SRPBCC family protein [Neobacillus vireti]|uniref:Activator of Hsp90 ATPase 1 family protein n=1 Tax=Neobacillus vireti LMG 21834 TaxID=1131730 RepID=A0AB94IS98_9BACI|nr:SRPBCC family protein [Neobacillus vireti]ETI69955.1 activator of Hsp90 ATPase 1 family protein [Neobacillus vireti LMG 21834]KLT15127.1 activator of Hsp90 ATPase 1 family protein [Neobacillus vireti]